MSDDWYKFDEVVIDIFCFSGELSADKLRLKLSSAIKQNDPELLENVISECVSAGHPDLMPDIQEARLHLESLDEGGRGLFLSLHFVM